MLICIMFGLILLIALGVPAFVIARDQDADGKIDNRF